MIVFLAISCLHADENLIKYDQFIKRGEFGTTLSSDALQTFTFYSYPYSYISTTIKDAKQNYQSFNDEQNLIFYRLMSILSRRNSSSTRSILEEALILDSTFFRKVPIGFVLISPFVEVVNGAEMGYVEISRVGDAAFVILEEGDSKTFEHDQLPLLKVWNRAISHYTESARWDIHTHEIRFMVRKSTLIVSGCYLFWRVMSIEIIESILPVTKKIKEAAAALIQMACARVIKRYIFPDIELNEAENMCKKNKISAPKFSLAVTVVYISRTSTNKYTTNLRKRQLVGQREIESIEFKRKDKIILGNNMAPSPTRKKIFTQKSRNLSLK